jgi:hypothetical protein
MNNIETMKLALEALQFGLHVGFDESSERQIQKGGKAFDQHNQAITALRQAIEQAQPEQDPCGLECDCTDVCKQLAQRQWVGLTDEEIRKVDHHRVDGAYDYSFKQGAKWAEAKLKEKNT